MAILNPKLQTSYVLNFSLINCHDKPFEFENITS